MRSGFSNGLGIPLFFKLWFAFVAFITLAALGLQGCAILTVIHAGPEGVGHMVGVFLGAAQDAARGAQGGVH